MATGTARYAEIAAELREWIEQGRLRPGDRVPSTREITRRWGVAMATATKVLTELRTQGLVHSVPGSGTTVAPRPTTPGRTSPRSDSPGLARTPEASRQRVTTGEGGTQGVNADPLQPGPLTGLPTDTTGTAVAGAEAPTATGAAMGGVAMGGAAVVGPAAGRSAGMGAAGPGAGRAAGPGAGPGRAAGVGVEAVVAAALGVADSEGLAAVSMRRIAGELDVATMTLYRHVADKDDLLMRMMDAAFAEEPLPAAVPGGWRPRLELVSGRLWRLFRRHPWLASAMSITRPQPIPHAIPYTEWAISAMEDHGLDRDTAFTAHITLVNYIRGTAINLETESEAEALTGLDNEQWINAQGPALLAIIDQGDFPRLRTLTEKEYDFDLDTIFTFGLHRYLDGLAPLLDA